MEADLSIYQQLPGTNMPKLPTWGERSSFSYRGSVKSGTQITFGRGWKTFVSARDYERLLQHFKGKRVRCGTTRTEPPRGSLGEWILENVTNNNIACYVGAILVHENFAVKLGPDILFG